MELIQGPNPDHAPIQGVERRWVMDDFEAGNGFIHVRHLLADPEDLARSGQVAEFPVTYRMTIEEWREKCRSEFGLNEDGTEVNDDDGHASGN
jgi:hypothetical protein